MTLNNTPEVLWRVLALLVGIAMPILIQPQAQRSARAVLEQVLFPLRRL